MGSSSSSSSSSDSNDPIPRYGSYKHSNPNYEDFEMWNSVCEDAEPGWEYKEAQREKERKRREARKKAARKEKEEAAKKEKEKKEREEKAKKAREEKQREERAKKAEEARKKAEQALKTEQERRNQEKATRAARTHAEHVVPTTTGLTSPSNHQQTNHVTRNQIRLATTINNNITNNIEEEDAVLGAQDDKPESQFVMPEQELAVELDELRDILRSIAESLKTEQADKLRAQEAEREMTEDDTQDQSSSSGWSGTCNMS